MVIAPINMAAEEVNATLSLKPERSRQKNLKLKILGSTAT